MATKASTKTKPTKTSRTRINLQASSVEAAVLGSTRLLGAAREALLHPDPAPLHEVPADGNAEAGLARMESFIGKGHLGAALREAATMQSADGPLAGRYAFIRQEKLSRTQLDIADRYRLRGDQANARRFYEQALAPDAFDPAVKDVAALAGRVFDDLAAQRRKLISGMKDDIRRNRFPQWCGRKKTLTDLTILDLGAIRTRIYPDFRLEGVFGERPPIDPDPGYLDPLPPESEFVAFPSAVPGAIFRAATEAAVDVNAAPAGLSDAPGNRVRASLAMPVVANVLRAKLGLFAIDQGLSVSGRADGVVPLFRYEHLRDKAKELIAYIQGIESRMLPIQFALDDFAELVAAIRRPLAAQEAELAAINQRIGELTQSLAQLTQLEQALEPIVAAFDQAEAQCDCDWFCWLVSIAAGVFIGSLAIAVTLALALSTGGFGAAVAITIVGELVSVLGATETFIITQGAFTCENVGTIGRQMKASLTGVQGAIGDDEAELQHALATRDILIASINALSDQLEQAYESNAARLLDAKTLDAIQAQYNQLRQSLLTRAQAVAKLAQDAFNFERDAEIDLVKDAYYDPDRKGYTAAETLLHDVSGFDHVDLTGRTQKALQLTHMVSLRKHQPMSFLALAATGRARFTTELAAFDRWYPGTYLQRIKEVRVEVLVDGEIVPVRGYISNDGTSLVRFADPDDKRQIDDVRVFAEPDSDIARLCYKRLQRRRHVDTMAFPAFDSFLADERMRKLQDRERNFFENVGLESTWLVELLPDQPFDLSRVSDIRVWFQYEALFDENLKRALEAKRYTGRREMVALPIAKLLRANGDVVDFAGTLALHTSRALFEAPAVQKTILDAGLAVRLKAGKPFNGTAKLELTYGGPPKVSLTTNDAGVVATAPDHPAGTGLAAFASRVQGKSVEGDWTVKLISLPTGLALDDVEEVFLLLHCEYAV
jgi:hypothetical protein